MDVNIDKKGGNSVTNTKSQQIWLKYMENNKMNDAWRMFNPDVEGYTWRKLRPTKICVRLDYILVSEALMQMVTKAEILPGFRTDHSIVLVRIHFEFAARGPGYWKMNTSLLHNRDFVDRINKLLDVQLGMEYGKISDKWEMVKLEIRNTTLQYLARRKKSNINKINVLERKVKRITQQMDDECGLVLHDQERQANLICKEIEEINTIITKSAMIRSKARWKNLGE